MIASAAFETDSVSRSPLHQFVVYQDRRETKCKLLDVPMRDVEASFVFHPMKNFFDRNLKPSLRRQASAYPDSPRRRIKLAVCVCEAG